MRLGPSPAKAECALHFGQPGMARQEGPGATGNRAKTLQRDAIFRAPGTVVAAYKELQTIGSDPPRRNVTKHRNRSGVLGPRQERPKYHGCEASIA
jgi:hypothetical protein